MASYDENRISDLIDGGIHKSNDLQKNNDMWEIKKTSFIGTFHLFKNGNMVELNNHSAPSKELLRILNSKFCSCNADEKTGSTSAFHCNICGLLEQSETWLK